MLICFAAFYIEARFFLRLSLFVPDYRLRLLNSDLLLSLGPSVLHFSANEHHLIVVCNSSSSAKVGKILRPAGPLVVARFIIDALELSCYTIAIGSI